MSGKNQKQPSEITSIITKETFGWTLGAFSVMILLIAFTGSLLFGSLGTAITSFLFGLFGWMTYPVFLSLLYLAVTLIAGKNFIPQKLMTVSGFCILALLGFLIHAVLTFDYTQENYGAYLAACFEAGNLGVSGCSPFGILGGLLVYPITALASHAGAYILFATGLGLSGYLFVNSILVYRKGVLEQRGQKQPIAPAAQERQPISFEELSNERIPQPIEPQTQRPGYAPQKAPVSYGDENVYTQPSYTPSAPPIMPVIERERPFANGQNGKTSTYQNSKDILYDPQINPAEYPNRNLIFDPSSQYNSRPQTSNTNAAQPKQAQEEYGNSSYSQLYSDDIDGRNQASVPEKKIVQEGENFSSGGYSMYKQEVFNTYPPANQVAEPEYPRPSYTAPTTYPAYAPNPTPNPAANSTINSTPVDVPVAPVEQPPVRLTVAEEQPPVSLRERFNPQPREEVEEQPVEEQEDTFEAAFESSFDKANVFDDDFDTDFMEDEEEEDVPDYRVDEKRSIAPERSREGLSSAIRETRTPSVQSTREPTRGVTPPERASATGFERTSMPSVTASTPVPSAPAPEPPKPRIIKEYVRPSLDLLDSYPDSLSFDPNEVEMNKQVIVETLAGFNVTAEVARVTPGPTFTRYDITIPRNVTARTIARYAEDISMALHSAAAVNIYSNFSQGTIAIEVPNRKRATVGMRVMLQSNEFVNAKQNSLTFCVGKDVEGKAVCCSLTKMPHMLVAGATGSGKSVFLNELIISLVIKYSPEELRLILIDPKQIEFAVYDKLPHLMINEIITDVNKAIVSLNWSINEMERRYTLFKQMTLSGQSVRNLEEYNAAQTEKINKLPILVIIVDELADLMSVAKKDIEDRISRIAAKARAAGIHLVLATQRPSVDVITGVLKSNLPSRFAFRVASEVDSRVILDETGAENLLGSGDLLYKTGSMFGVERVQGAWLASSEIQRICDFIRKNNEAYYDEAVSNFINSGGKTSSEGSVGGEEDDGEVESVYIDALRFVVQSGSASISMIQRKCSVGYNKAGKIIEWMELSGYISPFDGAKSRKVLITEDEFREKFGEL